MEAEEEERSTDTVESLEGISKDKATMNLNEATDDKSKSSKCQPHNSDNLTRTSSSSKSSSSTNKLVSFDRLKPRCYDDVNNKRTLEADSADSTEATAAEQAKKARKSAATRKEYSKLRHLVPALSEREDLSKVEIIEETIRYIDALHHQLAARAVQQHPQHQHQNQQQPEGVDTQSDTHPETTVVESPNPLRSLSPGSSDSVRRRPQQNSPSSSSPATNSNVGTSSPSSASSASRDSLGDIKAAVENIQAMFAAYLEQQTDETP